MEQPSLLRQIKASAGSGKTYTLTGEILRLLCGARGKNSYGAGCAASPSGELTWPEVLGVTFTNRAATEMKDRVLLNLKKMALGEEPPHTGWTAAHASRVLESLVRQAGALNIRTIDSLIHLIVRLSALDLDLPPDFEAVFSDAELLAPLLDELSERAREGDEALVREYSLACSRLLGTGKFRGFLAGERLREGVCELASLFLARGELTDESFSSADDIRAALDAMRKRFRSLTAELASALDDYDLHANFSKALAKCLEPANQDFELPSDSAYFCKAVLDDCLVKAKGKGKKGKGEAEDHVNNLYLRTCAAALDLETSGKILAGALRLTPFTQLAHKALDELAWFQHGSRRIPASGVSALAERVLGGEYGVSEAFCRMGNRLTHILVDEFQDTSRGQWNAIKPLAVEALSRGGSLTVVGDVKQAIYGWRGGDAALFDEVPADGDLTAMAPGPVLDVLEANWRSRSEIIAWNNAVFSQLEDPVAAKTVMHSLMRGEGGDVLLNVSASSLNHAFAHIAQQDARGKGGGEVRLSLLPPMASEDINAWLKEALPRRVLELRGRGRAWGDICILTQTNRQTAAAARWLLDAGVPVVTEGSLLLGEQPVVAQTVALMAFLDSPDDDRAFWSVLQGRDLLPPSPGLEDAKLHHWLVTRLESGNKGGRGLAKAFQQAFPDEWEAHFAPLLDGAGLLTPYDTVQEIYRRWRIWERHPDQRGFLMRLLEVMHLAEQRGYLDLASFLAHWREKGGEERAPLPENMDAARIMTIHKSKGLEAEAVLVPWSDFSLRDRADIVPAEVEGLRVLTPLSKAMGEPFYQARADNAREALNLLYVAWTRAISELHVWLPTPENDPMSEAVHTLVAPFLEGNGDGPRLERLAEGEWRLGGGAWPSSEVDLQGPTTGKEVDRPFVPGIPDAEKAARALENLDSGAVTDDWRPMHWLPRLKIFRSPLENWTLSAKRRGILMHRCLEFLSIGAEPASDARRAVRRGLMGLPLFEREELEREFGDALAWFAALPETRTWMRLGSPEHSLLDEQGGLKRVDLLVHTPSGYLAVEYKTGAQGDLPREEHVTQLETYLALLRASVGGKAGGVLVYLDRQQIFRMGDEW